MWPICVRPSLSEPPTPRTALMYAATNGDAGTARRLLEMNRKLVEDQDNAGNTALHLSIKSVA